MSVRVSVAVALAGRQEVIELELPEGARVRDAIRAARLAERFPELDLSSLAFGVWSRVRGPDAALRDGDRVEVYRPLVADPKAMRRRRAALRPPKRPRPRG